MIASCCYLIQSVISEASAPFTVWCIQGQCWANYFTIVIYLIFLVTVTVIEI